MKNISFIITILMSCSYLMSCKSSDDPDANLPVIIPDQPENVITTPCDFDISSVSANSTVVVDCLLDLKGDTLTLPENVNFEFKGGDIINGKMIFSGGTIDGRLLSAKLKVEGFVSLKEDVFKFYAVRWDLREGPTNSDIALRNTDILEKTMFLTKELGAKTFNIDRLDAYFEVTRVTSTTSNQNFYPSLESVNIPSNFSLVMTENTHLRIFPGGAYKKAGGAILAVRDVSNVTVSGGNLYGDRDQRVFSAEDNGTEGSHLFLIHSGKNITIDGVNFQDGSAGTFAIFSFGFSFNPDYNPTTNVAIKNCVIKDSRRMAIALVDGRDVVIEGNTFINAGQPSANTDGGEVGYAINIEPDRYRDDAGVLKERQRVFDVLIKGNKEIGSRGGFLTLTIGQDITVEDNDIGTRVVSSLVSGVKIINNRFKAAGEAVDSWAIFVAGTGETVYNNEVGNNNIEGYSLGVVTGSNEAYIHDNVIKDCGAGIQLSRAYKAKIINNTIDVTANGIQATNTFNDEIEIKGNKITTTGNFNVYFANMNNKEENKNYSVIFDDNTFNSVRSIVFSNSAGVTFKNNTVAGGLSVGNMSKTTIVGNTIQPSESHGIRLYDELSDVLVMDNTVSEPTGAARYECIKNESSTPSGISMSGNICN